MNPDQVKQLLPMLTAFAEGKDLQFRVNGGNWYPCGQSPDLEADGTGIEYRIKPEPVVVKYRRFLAKHVDTYRVYTAADDQLTPGVGLPSYFVRWIDDDWQEVEV